MRGLPWRMASFLTAVRPGMFNVSIHARPGARRSAFARPVNLADDAIDVRVGAPPVEGQANAELVDFMQSTLDTYVREMQAARASGGSKAADNSGLAVYFSGTSYTALLEIEKRAAVTAAASSATGATQSGGAGRGTGKKAAGKVGRKGTGSQVVEPHFGDGEGAPLPTRVSVTLSKGSTLRFKTLEVSFPGSEAELISVLQLASKDTK